EKDLKRFIRENFVVGKSDTTKIQIDKNNFIIIYNKWLETVKPTINVNWEIAKKNGLIDGDFYLADLLSFDNKTITEKLLVLLHSNHYVANRRFNEMGMFSTDTADFNDNQKSHTLFWNKYERPPLEDYWDYIINRHDLLVPQDIRERKGSFFTPQIWVEKSQEYLAKVFGENWQDEYYIWDCAAGSGNLLAGLTNKYNIWASTLDKSDVDIMKQRIENGANLLEKHVFQFDFLNDDFDKLPEGLQEIIKNPAKRKKLVIYINPPLIEHGNKAKIKEKGEPKTGVATKTKIYSEFQSIVGTATRDLSSQFFLRIYKEIPNCKLASFSTPKFINSQNFIKFRNYFKAHFEKGFITKSNTFDNVKGNFPIGFFIFDLAKKVDIIKIQTDIFLNDNKAIKSWQSDIKTFYATNEKVFISDWLRKYYDKDNEIISYIILPGVDMQVQNGIYFTGKPTESDIKQHKLAKITVNNFMEMCVYLSVRQCIDPTWLNNKDQFLFPNKKWEKDLFFQSDCIVYALFHGQNKVSSKEGKNYFIPFREEEVNAQDKFAVHFATNFFAGKKYTNGNLFEKGIKSRQAKPLVFSPEAQAVFDAGRELWKYYFKQPKVNVNASLYDIREYFQGRNDKGKMNNRSEDEKYNELIGNLRNKLKILAEKIEPKVYEYGFLKE
ncbi:MAG: hypothetical protein LBS69_00610, partial [Prevotellaceae bacterium]|nr:hypothetical protein [Prevotellaceae bacterium]